MDEKKMDEALVTALTEKAHARWRRGISELRRLGAVILGAPYEELEVHLRSNRMGRWGVEVVWAKGKQALTMDKACPEGLPNDMEVLPEAAFKMIARSMRGQVLTLIAGVYDVDPEDLSDSELEEAMKLLAAKAMTRTALRAHANLQAGKDPREPLVESPKESPKEPPSERQEPGQPGNPDPYDDL